MNNLDQKINLILPKYIEELQVHWRKIIKNKYNKHYNNLLSITHLTGIHIDFYHKPYLFMNKKYPEIIFRSVILNKIGKLNKLLYKEVFLPRQTINIMIEQCNFVVQNKDYWKRFEYTDFQINMIDETYKIFKNYLYDYLKYLDNKEKTFDKNIVGIGKSKLGEDIYDFTIKYHTGFSSMTPRLLQKYGLMHLEDVKEQIEKYTKKSFQYSLQQYLNNKTYFKNEKDLMSTAKHNIIKLHEQTNKIFDSTIAVPFIEKISIKPMPTLRSMWGTLAKSQTSTMMINTQKYDKMDKDSLMAICAHEAIPGHILEKYNSSLFINDISCKKKIKKYIRKGITACTEGWGSYSESIIENMYAGDPTLIKLFRELALAIKIVLDVGLNSKEAVMNFSYESAKEFIKLNLGLDNYIIENQILGYLVKPSFYAAEGLGYFLLKDLTENTKLDKKTFNSLFVKLPLTLDLFKRFTEELTQ